MRTLAAAFTALAIAAAAPAQAGLRCGRELVQEGESVAQLLLACGEPTLRQTIAVDNTSKTEGIVEQWIYDFGRGTLLQIVTLEGGKIASIEDGGRR
jgi:hypothetical protein